MHWLQPGQRCYADEAPMPDDPAARSVPNADDESPSYHDLHITTADLPRTSIFNLAYGLEVTCTRVAGWRLWNNSERTSPWLGAPSEPTLVCGEYDGKWLVLDVAGHVIVDSRKRSDA